ncbi:Archaeal ATPase [Caballeronia arationis]|uniref:TIR domain-containing protein n=1 Tax=Caballeronia arationis TaxID=1777142 RepID=UPI00074C609D|nr:TIR domain-containing protein [Caballeronia arationis]SAL04297.1 Archaeal ATPase [Caballeronia arationis]
MASSRSPHGEAAWRAQRPWLSIPPHFTDRTEETKALAGLLDDESVRVIAVCGRQGVGKSALVARALNQVERRRRVSKYVETISVRAVDALPSIFPVIRDLLIDRLGPMTRAALRPALAESDSVVSATLESTGNAFAQAKVQVRIIIEKFEYLVATDRNPNANANANLIEDWQTLDMLRFIALDERNIFKVILTTSLVPAELLRLHPSRFCKYELRHGLRSPHGEAMLRQIDRHGILRLKEATDEDLSSVVALTNGFPLAMERFVPHVQLNPSKTIREIVEDIRTRAREDIKVEPGNDETLWSIIGSAFDQLSPVERSVAHALAIHETSADRDEILALLPKSIERDEFDAVLNSLVRKYIANQESDGRFSVDKADRLYAIASMTTYRTMRLRLRAVNCLARQPDSPDDWRTDTDIRSQMAQFRLWLLLGRPRRALEVLERIVGFLDARGSYGRIAELAHLIIIESAKDARTVYRARHYLADAKWRMGDLAAAMDIQKTAHAEMERCGGLADELLESEGRLLRFDRLRGPDPELLKRCRAFAQKLKQRKPDDFRQNALALRGVVVCEFELGYLDEALETHERTYAQALASKDAELIGTAELDYGVIYAATGRLKKARKHFLKTLRGSQSSRHTGRRALHLGEYASCLMALGHASEAADKVVEALKLLAPAGEPMGIAYYKRRYAEILLEQGNLSAAAREAEQALDAVDSSNVFGPEHARVHAEIGLEQGNDAAPLLAVLDRFQGDLYPDWNYHNVRGIACLAEHKPMGAQESFERALHFAELYLKRCACNVDALAGKALALAGLAVSMPDYRMEVARRAYIAIADPEFGAGTLARCGRRLHLLGKFDSSNGIRRLLAELGDRFAPLPDSGKEVYVSYRHEPASTALVDEIELRMPSQFIFFRDSNELLFGDSIDAYMMRIGRAEHIIVVLSLSYPRRITCMTELRYVWERRDKAMEKRIVPVVTDSLRLDKRKTRDEYGAFWTSEYENLKASIPEQRLKRGTMESTELENIKFIRDHITEMLLWLSDILAPAKRRHGEKTVDHVISMLKHRSRKAGRHERRK